MAPHVYYGILGFESFQGVTIVSGNLARMIQEFFSTTPYYAMVDQRVGLICHDNEKEDSPSSAFFRVEPKKKMAHLSDTESPHCRTEKRRCLIVMVVPVMPRATVYESTDLPSMLGGIWGFRLVGIVTVTK
ncbi:hypothetical protein PM082_014561 [Marasmius tenuissimus]|nr:hypothetical protein PM082_014561 [Marasmius tenuissimus]